MNDKVQEKIIKWVLQTTFRNELEAQQYQINQLENKLLETKAKQEKINNCLVTMIEVRHEQFKQLKNCHDQTGCNNHDWSKSNV